MVVVFILFFFCCCLLVFVFGKLLKVQIVSQGGSGSVDVKGFSLNASFLSLARSSRKLSEL